MMQERIHARTPREAEPTIRLASHEIGNERIVFVVGHGWHTGIVLPTEEVPVRVWPEIQAFSDYRYVEVGWGDEGFYRMDGLNVGTATKAALWPTPSVLHVAAFDQAVDRFFAQSDVIALRLTAREFESLIHFIANTPARDEQGRTEGLGDGVYAFSRFFRGRESYYLPKTCNVWTAKALQCAGQPITPALCVTAEAVVRRAQACGDVVQESHAGLKRALLRAERPSQ